MKLSDLKQIIKENEQSESSEKNSQSSNLYSALTDFIEYKENAELNAEKEQDIEFSEFEEFIASRELKVDLSEELASEIRVAEQLRAWKESSQGLEKKELDLSNLTMPQFSWELPPLTDITTAIRATSQQQVDIMQFVLPQTFHSPNLNNSSAVQEIIQGQQPYKFGENLYGFKEKKLNYELRMFDTTLNRPSTPNVRAEKCDDPTQADTHDNKGPSRGGL